MSSEAMKWARVQKFGTMSLKGLVNAVAARADKSGSTWASQKTLAADVGASDRHVRGLLAELEAFGVVVRNNRSAGRQGRITDTITLAMQREFDLSAADVQTFRRKQRELREFAKASSNRNKPSASSPKFLPEGFVVPTGTGVPGNSKGAVEEPSQGIEAYQDRALQPTQPVLAVVAGTALAAAGGGR